MVDMELVKKVDADKVRDYFGGAKVLEHYAHAATAIGLWESESKVFQRVFPDKSASLLELGCGCGRISHHILEGSSMLPQLIKVFT